MLLPFLIPRGARMGNWLGKGHLPRMAWVLLGACGGVSGWWLLDVAGRQPDEDARAHGLMGVWVRDRGGLRWLLFIVLASIGEGVMMPIPVMVVMVMPPRVGRIIVAAAIIIAAVDADGCIAAAADDKHTKAANE